MTENLVEAPALSATDTENHGGTTSPTNNAPHKNRLFPLVPMLGFAITCLIFTAYIVIPNYTQKPSSHPEWLATLGYKRCRFNMRYLPPDSEKGKELGDFYAPDQVAFLLTCDNRHGMDREKIDLSAMRFYDFSAKGYGGKSMTFLKFPKKQSPHPVAQTATARHTLAPGEVWRVIVIFSSKETNLLAALSRITYCQIRVNDTIHHLQKRPERKRRFYVR